MSVSTSIKAIVFILSCCLFCLTWWEVGSKGFWFYLMILTPPLICVIIFLPLLWISCTETSLNRGVELYFCIVGCVFLFAHGGLHIDSFYASSLGKAIGSLGVISGLFLFGYIIYSCCSKTPRQSVHSP